MNWKQAICRIYGNSIMEVEDSMELFVAGLFLFPLKVTGYPLYR
jgi:hypothetical protein